MRFKGLILAFLPLFLQSQIVVQPGAGIVVGNGAKLSTSGLLTLTLQSTASGTGSFVDQNPSGSTNVNPAGGVIVQRYIPGWSDANHGWHFLSTPVVSQAISPGFVDISGTISSNQDFYRWSEPFDTWVNIKNASNDYNMGFGELYFSNDNDPHFQIGKGYLVAYGSNATKQFSGVFNLSDVTVSGLTYTTPVHTYLGWHLLGNPYPAALIWNKTGGSWNLSNIDANCQIWNESTASYTIITANGIIPAMNGFMVHVSAHPGSLTIPKSAQTQNFTAWYKNSDEKMQHIILKAIDPAGQTAQETIIRFNELAQPGYDGDFDSQFLPGFAPQFYSYTETLKYALNTLPLSPDATAIQLGFLKNSSSVFNITMSENTTGKTVYLRDKNLGIDHQLSEGPYFFSAAESDDAQRFILHFGTLGQPGLAGHYPFLVYQNGNKLCFQSNSHFETIHIFDLSGRLIHSQKLENSDLQPIDLRDVQNGILIIRASGSSGSLNQKVVFVR